MAMGREKQKARAKQHTQFWQREEPPPHSHSPQIADQLPFWLLGARSTGDRGTSRGKRQLCVQCEMERKCVRRSTVKQLQKSQTKHRSIKTSKQLFGKARQKANPKQKAKPNTKPTRLVWLDLAWHFRWPLTLTLLLLL